MIDLHERGVLGATGVAEQFEKLQEAELRIDIVRNVWLEQMAETDRLLGALESMQHTTAQPMKCPDGLCVVGVTGFEPATSSSRTRMRRINGRQVASSKLVVVPVSAVLADLVTLLVMPFCCLTALRGEGCNAVGVQASSGSPSARMTAAR
jgi:hypothetical protein